MKARFYLMILLVAFSNISTWAATSIEEVSRHFAKNEIDYDSLHNYIYDNNHAGEVYWWALHNSQAGDAMANYILGRCYLSGIGTSQNEQKAIPLFEKAISDGIDEGLVDLGKIYLNGWGVDKDYAKAIKYLKQSSDKGNPRGKVCLGITYFDKQEYDKAISLYKAASEAGYSGGYLGMGYMHEMGYGVERDLTKALDYYLKASQKGDDTAMCNIGLMYENGIGVDMDHKMASKYYQASAAKGNERGEYKVGNMYRYGDFTEEVSYEKAATWYRKSADKNYTPAKVELAFMMFEGLGMPENKPQAVAMLESVDKKYIASLGASQIAEYYFTSNPVKAIEWAKHAYDTADEYFSTVESAKLLGLIYLKGGKEVYDYNLAVKYLREGAELDQPERVSLMQALGDSSEEPIEGISPGISPSVEIYGGSFQE